MERRWLFLPSCALLCSCSALFPFQSADPTGGDGDADSDAGGGGDSGADGDADGGACPPDASSCDGETCETPLWLPVGETIEGNTNGAENDYRTTLGGDGPDQVFVWVPAQTGLLEVGVTAPSSWAPIVYLREGCSSPALSEDEARLIEGSWSASLQLCVTAGALYNVFVDGFRGYSGPYVLRATFWPCSGCTGASCPQ